MEPTTYSQLIFQLAKTVLEALSAASLLLIPAAAAYIKHRLDVLSSTAQSNTGRITSLENGGGDAKVDARLAQHGVPLAPDAQSTVLVPGTKEIQIGGPAVALVLCLLLGFAAPRSRADTDPAAQMLLGNPDNAAPVAADTQHFLVSRPQYALSYNGVLLFPNWVSWHLQASDIGASGRSQFIPDLALPHTFTVVMPADYTKSGYDRGHNCPSEDRSDTIANNEPLFLMSNISPEAPGLNRGPWERMEAYCRTLAKQGNELYITCGAGFSAPGQRTLGTDHIAIPDFWWKVVVVLPDKEGNDLERMGTEAQVFAVRMPNINTTSKVDWRNYIVAPREIEQATGLQFFTALPQQVADVLRGGTSHAQSSIASSVHQ